MPCVLDPCVGYWSAHCLCQSTWLGTLHGIWSGILGRSSSADSKVSMAHIKTPGSGFVSTSQASGCNGYLSVSGNLTVQGNLLMKGCCIVIPAQLKTIFWTNYTQATKVSPNVWNEPDSQCGGLVLDGNWKILSIYSCPVCCKERIQPSELFMPTKLPKLPREIVVTDLFFWKGSDYLLVVDYLSRYIEIAHLSTTTSGKVIRQLKIVFAL